MRLAPISGLVKGLLDFQGSVDTPIVNVGTLILAAPTDGVDTGTNVPNWGQCELLYVKNVSTAITPGILVVLDKDFNATAAPSTAGLGKSLYVTLTSFALGSTTPQYGWVMVSGVAPIQTSVAATTGLVYIGTAGVITPTQANGKQVLNAACTIAAASAFTRTIQTANGSKRIGVSRVNGIFIGQAITGTGISSTVASIDPGGNAFYTAAAATATGSVTGTFTPTGYGIVQLSRPFAQGQVV
jgi:hypothetical protein